MSLFFGQNQIFSEPNPILYTIIFNVDPIDAIVILDEEEGVNIDGVVTFQKLAGNYSYEVSSEGYISQSSSIEVSENVELNITLASASAQIKYGYLYNGIDLDLLPSGNDWRIPTPTDKDTLLTFINFPEAEGMLLKEIGTTYWNSNNEMATNALNFNFRGSGDRSALGVFGGFKAYSNFWIKLSSVLDSLRIRSETPGLDYFSDISSSIGNVVRLVRDSEQPDGTVGTYTGNDGRVYRTICIGTQEWLADNLAETEYNNGSNIPTVTNATTWANLVTGAKCAPDNDENNVLI